MSFFAGRSLIKAVASQSPSIRCISSQFTIRCTRMLSTAEGTGPKDTTVPSPSADVSLEQQLAEKDGKLREVSDSYLRCLADMENLRNRTKKEIESASQFAISRFSKDIISVADVLEMALHSVDPQHPLLVGPAAETAQADNDASAVPNGNGATQKFDQLIKGIEMTLEEVRKVLKKHGVVPIEPLHQPFDPNLHNALFQVPTADVEPGTVVSVAKRGYLLHHRVLRAADVGVSKQA